MTSSIDSNHNSNDNVEQKGHSIEHFKRNPAIAALSSATAAGLSTLLIQPVSLLKTRLQSLNIYDHGIKEKKNLLMSLLMSCRKDGILSLYKGSSCAILLSASGWFIFRFSYDYLSRMNSLKPKESFVNDVKNGCISSFITTLTLHPIWNARLSIELQSHATRVDGWPKYRGAIHYLMYTYRNRGFRSLYIGVETAFASILHYTMLIALYDSLSRTNWKSYPVLSPFEGLKPFLCGAVARFVPTVVCYPVYVSRTMQLCYATELSNMSLGRILLWTMRNKRLKGAYAGFQLQVFKSMLNGGLMFTLYEFVLTNFARLARFYVTLQSPNILKG